MTHNFVVLRTNPFGDHLYLFCLRGVSHYFTVTRALSAVRHTEYLVRIYLSL